MVINQIAAIGDILFIEPICRHFWNKNGEKPILPIRDHLMWLSEYIESANFIPMSKFQLDYDSMATHNPDYLPLRFAAQIINNKPADYHLDYADQMPAKYELAGLPLELWKTLDIKVDGYKGLQLYRELINDISKKYILVNNHSQAGVIDIEIKCTDEWNVIYMDQISGYTVLDWAYLIAGAEEFHTVSTCTFYILQAMKNKGMNIPKVFIYPRPNDDGLQGISKLMTDFNWIGMDSTLKSIGTP